MADKQVEKGENSHPPPPSTGQDALDGGVQQETAYSESDFFFNSQFSFFFSTEFSKHQSGYAKQVLSGEMSPEFKKLIDYFSGSGEQLIVCENPDTFTTVMSIFTQYEKHDTKTQSSQYAKNIALKTINHHLLKAFVRDFPFNLVVAYRMIIKSSIYWCNEMGVFVRDCMKKMENMDPRVATVTLTSFLQRGDFLVPFGGKNPTSVFHLLQQACIEIAKISHITCCKGAKPSVSVYPKFVYNRFMWASLYLRVHADRDMPQNTTTIWQDMLIKYSPNLVMDPQTVAEVKEGLECCRWMQLPSDLTFSTLHLAKLFASEGYVRPFSQLSGYIQVLQSYISQEKDFYVFLTTVRAEYDFRRKQTGPGKFIAVSVEKTLAGSIEEGLTFVDTVYKFCTEHKFNPQMFGLECKKWFLLLLQLVDFTEDNPHIPLKAFFRSSTHIVNWYRADIIKRVIDQTYASFPRLTLETFSLLYKAFSFWPNEIVEKYLQQYKVPSGVRISDEMWKELFSEVVKRFSGAQHHHYLLDFLQSVAERYHKDGRAGDLVVDLLKLEVPKLFAVEGGSEEDEAVRCEFSRFLQNYIIECDLPILEKRKDIECDLQPTTFEKIMDAISDQHDEFQQLVLTVIQMEMVPERKVLQEEKFTTSPLYTVLREIVTMLGRDISWLQSPTTKQNFCWGIIASCCEKIAITKEQFEWVQLYESVITCVGEIYCLCYNNKQLQGEKCLLSADGFPQEIALIPSANIKKYFDWVRDVQGVLLKWKEMFIQQECNYDEIVIYTSRQSQIKHLAQTFCVSSAIVDAQAVKNTFLNDFEQLNVLLIKYIPGQPDAKWCNLPSLLHHHGVTLSQHLLKQISQHVLFPEEERVEELLDSPLSPNISGKFQPGHDISLKLTKTLSLRELSNLVKELKTFLEPITDVLDVLVFFKLHLSKVFDKYIQAYLNTKSELREQHTTTFLSMVPSTCMMKDQNKVEGVTLYLLQKAVVHTHKVIRKLMQGTAMYSEIVAEGELNLENLNIEQEFIMLQSFLAYYLKPQPPLASYEVWASVQSILELFQYVHHIRNIHSVCEQYQQQGFQGDPELIKLCQRQAELVLLEWKNKFMEQKTNYNEIFAIANQQSQLENLGKTIWASSDIVNMDIPSVENMFLNAFQQLNAVFSMCIPGQPAIKWRTLPFFLQSWGVALPPQLLDLISQHVQLSEGEKVQNSPLSPNIMSTFQPGHAMLTKALSLHELSFLVEEIEKFLQNMLQLMLELPQYASHIQVIHRICEQYQLKGCLDDPQLVELCQLAEYLNLEGNHAKMTPVEASQKTDTIKVGLCLSSGASPHCLELFTAVGDSTAFYQFVRDKQFVGEKGQAVFQQQYQLITAQLQHEEYNETVLNHLYAAFKFISPFMDTHQNFQQLMSQVTNLDVTNEMKQLQTVNTNITLIQLWFSRAEGDTLENVTKELDCIIETGHYFFNTSSSVTELMLEYNPSLSHQSSPSPSQPSSVKDPEAVPRHMQTFPYLKQQSQSVHETEVTQVVDVQCETEVTQVMNVQRWNHEQIGDFVCKLGFLDMEKIGDKIKNFLHVNETAYKLLDLSVRLKELGHPNYIDCESLSCGINREEADKMICKAKKVLAEWIQHVDELRNQYHWLLFFSVPKMLHLYHLLQEKNPNVEAIVREISFLCRNDPAARKNAQVVVKKPLVCTKSDEAPMYVVGMFLETVFAKHSLTNRCGVGLYRSYSFSQLSSPELSQLLHYCPGYSQAQLIQLIVSIYDGVPEAFEVFRCHPSSTKEELSLFLERLAKHPLQYLILGVNLLPFKLQEHLMQLYLVIQKREVEISSKAPCIHLVETAPSILRKMPWIVLKNHTDPSLNFEEAREICLPLVVKPKDLTCVQLVYGHAGDGKTHYIKQQLADSPASVTVSVNEAFTPLKAISKLNTLPLNRRNCAIFFNFTMLPPGGSVHESERVHHKQLIEVIGWFFFDLFMLGYVEDSDTGQSFCLPEGQAWAIYVEVPSRDLSMTPKEALKHFQQEVPALGLLGTPHYINPDIPYTLDKEVQLVCKYLNAFRIGGEKGIDRLYQEGTIRAPKPVKFGSQADLKEEKCRELLQKYVPKHARSTKIAQRLFIKYMNRRCVFLDNLPAFNYNTGRGEYLKDQDGKYITDMWGKRVCSDTKQLGSTLMETMLREVEDFYDPAIKNNWSLKPHQQLIYDFKDGGFSLGLITLNPAQLPEKDKIKLQKIDVKIPSMMEFYSRELLDEYLSRALGVDLEDGRLTAIDSSKYVLTLDYTIKMLNIHERYKCGMPVIIEGETGVGKTALVEMLSKLWNHALLLKLKRQHGRLLDLMRKKLEDISTEVSDNYETCVQLVEALSAGEDVTEKDLILLGQLPDPQGQFYCQLRSCLHSMKSDLLVPLLILPRSQQQKASLEQLFERAETENSAESTASLLYGVMFAEIMPTFHKLNIHSAMTATDLWNSLEPVFSQAKVLQEAFKKTDTCTLDAPFVTVFLDELNTSSCLGVFKEIIVDRTFDGNPIPENVFIVAACNPSRGNSLSSHSQETWVRGAYYVRQLHPTLHFLMWDYGSLDKHQERDYINAKMKILNKQMPDAEVACLTELIITSQNLMRDYAFHQLSSGGLGEHEARISSGSCVSQRDIQRVFTFYQWVMDSYTRYKPYGERQDYSKRAVLVALGIVYYMRLNNQYRKKYQEYLDKQVQLHNEVSFSQAFSDELNWYINRVELPIGISRTWALKENLFATIVCTVTQTPLIIVGAPGSSKTLSFNLAIANLKGQESKVRHFRDTKVFRSLDPHFYQCSRQTTSNEIRTVFTRAINRQRSHCMSKLPIYCVVFMDEAGLPEESHESLKVLHYHLDQQEVSFVAITNHVLDAAKTNRAVSLFRPEASMEDLETLAKGCFCNTSDEPPPELQNDLKAVVQFCSAFSHLMKESEFRLHFGLRDFIHFVSYLRRQRAHNRVLKPRLVMEALERNFNGSDNFNEICNKFLKKVQSSMDQVPCRSILEVLKDSLEDCPQQQGKDIAEAEVRYKLIVDPSEDDSLVRLLFSFGVLQRKETRIFMCSDFPGNTQLQMVNTIAAIRHSAIEGHTVVMTQTNDIHESFYELFNQRFRRIDVPGERSRYYTSIAIGAHTKPSRVDPNFQCVVVIKKSEVKNTPAPFLNRFEKYCITHHSLLEVALSHLPPCIRVIVKAAMEKVQDFINHISGSSSLYGLVKGETLDSLVLSLIPQLTHSYESLEEPQVIDSSVESTKDPSVVEEPPKELSVVEEPTKDHSVVEEPTKDHSVVEEPTKDHSVVEEPTKDHSVVEEPTKDHSVVEEPTKELSVVEEPTKELSVVEEPTKELSVVEEPPKKLSVMDGSLDPKVLLMKELLQNLHHCAGFNIPPYSLDELCWDTDSLILSGSQFESLLPNFSHSTTVQAVAEAVRVLCSAPAPQDGTAQLSTECYPVVTLLQQWLVRYLCKRLMQLMTSEAFILYRNVLPSSYLENYISFQAHFSLKELILALEHSGWIPTKLLCFTRSSPLIDKLPAQYPSPVLDAQAASISQHNLRDLVFPDPSKLVVCTLSSLESQSSMQEMLKEFVLSDKAQVCLLVVNMQETSRQVVNHLRIMIEEAELLSTQKAKLFVMLLHFPPAQFFDHCYPSLFLRGWDHYYLDTVAHSADKGVIDIKNWFKRCCFPKETSANDSLVVVLMDILPEAIPVLYSRVFFGSNKQGTFNKPMNGSQRSKALKELLFKKGVGQILCEKFCSYWKPAVMTKYLERTAMFTRDHESTLNITDSLQIVFKGLFFDFLVYMLSQTNDSCNIDVLFDSDCKDSESRNSDNKNSGSRDSDSTDSDINLAIQELFLDILQTFSLPNLSQLQFLSTSLSAPTPDHSPQFPFFKMVCEAVERIVKQSHDEINVPLDLVQEDKTESMNSFNIRDHFDILQEGVKKRIKEKMEATPKECLVLAVKAMELHPDLWQRYYDDFLMYKLRLGGLNRDAVSQQILNVLFQQLHKQDAISHVVSLHCYTHIHHVDLVKMTNLLQPLNQIQQTTTVGAHLLVPTDPEGEALAKATQTQNLLGTPELIATFVVNTLFAAILEATNASVTTVPEKMTVWFKAYRDLMTLSAVKKSAYEPLGSEAGGQRKVVEAKLNVMQAVFLTIQTSPSLREEILQKGLHIFKTLLNEYFTTTLKHRPNLAKMASVTLKIMSETTSRVSSVQLLVEGLFAHFFSSYRHGYHTEDVQWFLEQANKQEQWRADPLEHSQHQQPVTSTETNTALQIPQEAISMSVFKLYLGRILGPHDQCVDKEATLSAPLLLHFERPRSQVDNVLMATANLGSPAPYIPTFYQRCTSIIPRANHERMQQPLAHLYFLTLLEHLQAKECKLSGLVRTANAILQQCASATTKEVESVVLWIELQAVVQVILQKLAVHLNPSKPRMEEVHPVADDINRLLDAVETGGGDTNGHGTVLAMHMMKQFKSSRKLTELFTRKYDFICSWLHCLKPFHEQFTTCLEQKLPETMPHHLPFMRPGAETTELGALYLRVRRVMVDVHERRAKMKSLIHIAEECCQSLQVKDGSSTHLSTESNIRGSVVDKRHCFRMMVWFCAYYDFYDKKITSELLSSAVEDKLAPYLQEKCCIRLIQCFLNPKLMLCHSESPNPYQEDNSVLELEREGKKIDPLHQLFVQSEHKPIGQSDIDLHHSLANLVGVILGCPSNSNHLWYHLFSPRELSGTYMTGFMYNAKIDPDDLLYDCGVELSSEGLFGRQDYVAHATRGTYPLHSLYLLLWANFGAFCMALLTQPEAEAAIHGPIISKRLSVRQYCVSKLHTVWKHIRNNLGLSDEERSFLVMCCTKRLYNTFKSRTTAPDCLQGIFQTCQELDSYEKMWHTHIYHPSWSELKTKYSQQLNKVFIDIRCLGQCYPHFPTEQDFIHSVLSTGDICSYTQKRDFYLLSRFAQEWPRLQAGGLLLPDLVEFYQWLHTALVLKTKEQARTLPIGRVVELAAQRYEEGGHIQALYNRVKDGYNQYVRLSGGTTSTGACSALRQGKKIYTISDDTPLLHFLSDEANKEESNDRLYIVAADIIAAHNTFIEAVYSYVQAQQLSLFFLDEPQRVYPSEVNDSCCIVGKLRSVNGINDFLQLIRSRYQPSSDDPMELQTVKAPFQLSLLQKDIVAYFLMGKPLIYTEPSSPLRIPFKFHHPTNSVKETDVVGPALDMDNIIKNLPDTFKAPLEKSLLNQLEYEFHSASYHTMVEVVTGLRTVAQHLVKAVMEKNCEGLEQKTVPQFLSILYGHDKESKYVLEEIGVCSTSHSQLVCLIKLPLPSLLYCLQLFYSWVRDGVYDFAALPYGLKSCLSSQDVQSIEQIPSKWTGTPEDLLIEIKHMNDVLKHSEACIKKAVNESAHKPLMEYLQEIHHLRMEDRLLNYIPSSILIQHYVYFRIALRRLALTVQQQVNAEADNDNIERKQWREVVDDLWKDKLPHLRDEMYNGPFVYDPQTGRYGFQEGLEYDSKKELMDDLMNEVEGEDHVPKGNGEDPDHHVTSVSSHSLSYNQEFYNDGAFVYDPQTGRYGFQESLDYDSEEKDHLFIAESQTLSLQFSRREKEEGTGHAAGGPKQRDEDTQTLEQSAQDCTPERVGQFLEEIGLGHHVAKFTEKEVSGDILLEPDQEMLEELGVTSVIERLKIKVLFRRSLQGGEAQYPLQTVLVFLEQNKLDKYRDIFEVSGMDGDLLLEADDKVLNELGVTSAVERLKIKVLFRHSLQGGELQYPPQTVLDFLEQNKLGKHCVSFQQGGIDGDLLLEADDSVLKELGVTSAFERNKIKAKFKRFISSNE